MKSTQVILRGNLILNFRCIESYSYIERQLKYKPTNITYTPLLRERNPGEDILKSYSDV
jgi:hypothetical protein